MYFMTRCCCYGEIQAEWPDSNRRKRRDEVGLGNVGG